MPSTEWWGALFGSIDSKDTSGFLDFLAEDAEFRFGNGPSAHGRDAVGAAVNLFFEAIRASEHDLVKNWHDDESAVCEGRVRYTRHDGSEVTLPFVDVLHMRGDKVARYYIYMDVSPLFRT
jgi:ketosteroid isomerase-like protein